VNGLSRGLLATLAFFAGLVLCVAGFVEHNNTGATEIGLPLVTVGVGGVIYDALQRREPPHE
jgi:hypothetical protein